MANKNPIPTSTSKSVAPTTTDAPASAAKDVSVEARPGIPSNPVNIPAPAVEKAKHHGGQRRMKKGPPSASELRAARERSYRAAGNKMTPEMIRVIEELTDPDTGVGPAGVSLRYKRGPNGEEIRYPEGHPRAGLRVIAKCIIKS